MFVNECGDVFGRLPCFLIALSTTLDPSTLILSLTLSFYVKLFSQAALCSVFTEFSSRVF